MRQTNACILRLPKWDEPSGSIPQALAEGYHRVSANGRSGLLLLGPARPEGSQSVCSG